MHAAASHRSKYPWWVKSPYSRQDAAQPVVLDFRTSSRACVGCDRRDPVTSRCRRALFVSLGETGAGRQLYVIAAAWAFVLAAVSYATILWMDRNGEWHQ